MSVFPSGHYKSRSDSKGTYAIVEWSQSMFGEMYTFVHRSDDVHELLYAANEFNGKSVRHRNEKLHFVVFVKPNDIPNFDEIWDMKGGSLADRKADAMLRSLSISNSLGTRWFTPSRPYRG
jgi:hypothetical protein